MKLMNGLFVLVAALLLAACGAEPEKAEQENVEQGTVQQSADKPLSREQRNKIEGDAFLAENAVKEGVITTASGLQYKVLVEGDGPSPKAKDTVEVHYHGTLINGTVFDSSVDRGESIQFSLNRVIPGWTEGLQLMKVGGKTVLYVPSELAYGGRAPSPVIGANATLIFEVELLDIPSQM